MFSVVGEVQRTWPPRCLFNAFKVAVVLLPLGVLSLIGGSPQQAAHAASRLPGYKAEPGEPLVEELSIPQASSFLQSISLAWTRQNECGTCHTNLAHIMARPFLEQRDPAIENEIRESLFAYLDSYTPTPPPERARENNNAYWLRLPVMASFAIGNAQVNEVPDGRILEGYDKIWSMQSADGSFDWPSYPLPFLEGDAHYIATLVSLGASYLPASYLETPRVAKALGQLNEYLGETSPKDLHGRLMLMWAAAKTPRLKDKEEKANVAARVLSLQREDGGWNLASLGDWRRQDGSTNDGKAGPSDGYGTGFVLFILCKSGLPVSDRRITRGLEWLKTHQRASGRWFTPSLWSNEMHNYVSTIGTAYAVMALKTCQA